jgi:hypothetical protein
VVRKPDIVLFLYLFTERFGIIFDLINLAPLSPRRATVLTGEAKLLKPTRAKAEVKSWRKENIGFLFDGF